MFDLTLTRRDVADRPSLDACQIVRPWVKIRPANIEEQYTSRVWSAVTLQQKTFGADPPDVCAFEDGNTAHAPEVISAFRRLSAEMPADFTLIYLHRGAQSQCVNPLLPSFLHLTGHDGPSYALRRDGQDALPPEVLRFARAMTPMGRAALIVDDRQLRLAPPCRMIASEVHFFKFVKPGIARKIEAGACQ